MSLLALSLVLISAFAHATWNYLAKTAGSGTAFVWLIAACSMVLYLPVIAFILITQQPAIGVTQITFMLGNAVLHSLYFVFLQRGYQYGDLSVMYPLARGTGPALSTLAAVVLLGERPTLLVVLGGALIIIGVFLLSGGVAVFRKPGAVIGYGLLTGVIIATYTLWDKQAVSVALIPPLLLDSCSNIARTGLLLPFALRVPSEIRRVWREHWRKVLGVAILSPLAYVLVLTVLTFSPVSSVAPLREVSILIGVVMGTRLLSEGNSRERLLSAGMIVAGVIAIALG